MGNNSKKSNPPTSRSASIPPGRAERAMDDVPSGDTRGNIA